MEGEQRRTKGLSKPCIMLIVIAGKERFAFKGVASNLVTYLTDVVKMSNSSAAKTVNNWCGLTSIMPLLLAPLADSYWDRYSTIISFSIIYVLGLVALTATAFAWSPTTSSSSISSSAFLYSSLCLISLGQGGYNPSLQAFGADQLDNDEDLPSSKDTQKPNKKSVFFTWWYFGVCSGSLLGVTVMSYIQDTYGWVLGFAIPTVVMVISTVFFACGSRIYTYKSDEKTEAEPPFPSIVGAIKAAASKLNMSSKTKLPKEEEEADLVELELQQKPLCQQNLGSGNKDLDEDQISKKRNYLAENAKLVIRLLPIWTMLLMFAVIFQQPSTFFTKQGMTMKRNIGSSFKIPPATLQSSITVSIILLMPLYDTVLIPIMQKITRNEKGISVMQRMGVGMFLSIIAMVIAAKVETKRIEMSKQMGNNSLDSEPDQTVPLSIFCLLPQYILLGISDIFTVVGMQEFFYNEVPVRMRTMAFALYTSVFGVGSFMSALFITLIEAFTSSRDSKHGWFSDDMREARIDKYYWLLAMTSALSFLLYLILCRFFKSRTALDSENCQ